MFQDFLDLCNRNDFLWVYNSKCLNQIYAKPITVSMITHLKAQILEFWYKPKNIIPLLVNTLPSIQIQVIVRTGRVSNTVQTALRPQGSARVQGFWHSPFIQACCEGHSTSLRQPIERRKVRIV